MQLQIAELLALQEVDTEISRLHAERETLDRGERVERALASRQAKLASMERRLQTIEAEQRTAELELKSLEEKKHTESRKLYEGRITAPRELQALQAEVEGLERQRQRLDDAILRRAEELEAARKNADAARSTVEEAEKALSVMRKRFEKASSRIDSELAKYEPKRARIAKKIDKDTLRRYDDIRKRNHNVAAVRVQIGACGGCRMKVGSAVLRRIAANDSYVYCESCTRFLFASEDEA